MPYLSLLLPGFLGVYLDVWRGNAGAFCSCVEDPENRVFESQQVIADVHLNMVGPGGHAVQGVGLRQLAC